MVLGCELLISEFGDLDSWILDFWIWGFGISWIYAIAGFVVVCVFGFGSVISTPECVFFYVPIPGNLTFGSWNGIYAI